MSGGANNKEFQDWLISQGINIEDDESDILWECWKRATYTERYHKGERTNESIQS